MVADKAVEFILEAESDDRPFFLWVSPYAAHAPHVPALRHRGALAALTIPRTPDFNESDASIKGKVRGGGSFRACCWRSGDSPAWNARFSELMGPPVNRRLCHSLAALMGCRCCRRHHRRCRRCCCCYSSSLEASHHSLRPPISSVP